MSVRVETLPEADVLIDELESWWRENRSAAASQVLDEVGRVIALLSERPELGVPYKQRGLRNIRWVRLRKTPYKLYYHYEPGGEVVSIVSVWSGMRRRGPPLGHVK